MFKEFCLILVLLIAPVSQTIGSPNCVTKKGGYFAAINEETFDAAMEYAVQKDTIALKKLFDAGLIFTLKPGVRVSRKSAGFLSGKIKIRPVGSTAWFWTVMEAVSCS